MSGLQSADSLKDGRQPHREQVALVDELPLALLQLRAQAPQLSLVFPQQRALVHVLVHLTRTSLNLSIQDIKLSYRPCAGDKGEVRL